MVTGRTIPEANQLINEFFAVTQTSIYQARATGDYRASVVKVALKGESSLPVGYDLTEGGMIAIRQWLQGFIPEKYGFGHPMTGLERHIEQVNTRYWRGKSSSIVALFRTEAEARICFECDDLQPCDPRWVESTRQVLEDIGDEHPSFYITRTEQFGLPLAVSQIV